MSQTYAGWVLERIRGSVRRIRRRVRDVDVVGTLANLPGLRLDYAFALLMLWQVFGGVLDIQKHARGFSFAEEGFITLEHSIMYTGFLILLGLLLAVTVARRYRKGLSWLRAIPPGYGLGFLGLLLWGLAGPGDLLWHHAFGLEEGFTALLSPTHLTLALGAGLFLSSPLRAAWRREFEPSWRTLFPSVLAATFTLTIATMFTMYAHPTFTFAGVEAGIGGEAFGVSGFLVQTTMLAGLCCLLVRRFDVPAGAFTLVLANNGAVMAFMGTTNHPAAVWFLLSFVAAGVVADVLSSRFGRMRGNTARLRVFCVAVPVSWTVAHFAVVEFVLGDVAWETHTWTGTIFLAGVVGLLVSVLVAPSPYDPSVERADTASD